MQVPDDRLVRLLRGSIGRSRHRVVTLQGIRFPMADGSVRFIKDSIDSWPMDAQTATPLGVIQDASGLFQLTGGARFHVYQALTTRNGGEILSADSY